MLFFSFLTLCLSFQVMYTSASPTAKGSRTGLSLEEQKQLLEDWDTKMRDFIPDDMITFQVEPKSMDFAFEEINKPTTVRGAFFTHDQFEKVDFVIRAPSGQTLYSQSTVEGIFAVNTTENGMHEFIFDNRKGKLKKIITLALDVHDSLQDQIEKGDIDPIETDVKDIKNSLQEVFYEYKFSQMRFDSSYESMKGTNQKIMIFTIIETIAIVLVTVWQIWYIKKLFDSPRLV